MQVKRLEAKYHVDSNTGFLFRYICSETEFFILHCHDYYEIFLTLEGDIIHDINGKLQNLKEGSLVFVRPDDVHNYICDSEKKYRFLNLTFTKDTVETLFSYFGDGFDSDRLLKSKMPTVVSLDKDEQKRLLYKFQQFNTIKFKQYSKSKFHMRMLLAEILSEYFSDTSPDTGNLAPLWLDDLCRKMNIKENFEKGSGQMILLSGKTREHLARSLRKYYGVTISEYINNLRLNFSANMLINSNMPILDICFESGFDNVSWFYDKFREKYGETPKMFRNKYGRR